MRAINSVLNAIFDTLTRPWGNLNPWGAMVFISLLTGLFMLLVFKLTSDQKGLRRAKDRIKAHLLEFRLFKDSIGATSQAFGGILLQNLRYLSYTLKPLLVMIVPLLLILTQLNARFGYKPLGPGEQAILKVKMAAGVDPLETDISIQPSPHFVVETPPLRIGEEFNEESGEKQENEVDWRLRATSPGRGVITLVVRGRSFTKTLDVGASRLQALSPRKPTGKFFDLLFNPAEEPIPSGLGVISVELVYPESRLPLLGFHIHWLLAFFVLSLVFGLGLKGLFKVEV